MDSVLILVKIALIWLNSHSIREEKKKTIIKSQVLAYWELGLNPNYVTC